MNNVGDRDAAAAAGESEAKHRAWRLAWIAVYSLALLLALRFGGRTYPGWYLPNSPFLNSLLNGNWLFTRIGYDLVLVGACAAAMRVLLGRKKPRASSSLRLVQWVAFGLAILIILYGVRWAIWTQRLPWQPDGQGRYPPFASISS
jgi:hypothetical protein